MQEKKQASQTRPLVMTIAEAGVALGISRSTVNRWAKEGKLVKRSFGRNTARITTDSVYALACPA
jgi:excisionase family DNA binding protein